MRSALITGITGQDGAYLAKFLLGKGYEVYGTYRRLSTPNFWRLDYLGITKDVGLISADLGDESSLVEAVRASKPDEIYHLAAQSFVEASFSNPISTGQTTGMSVTRMLEVARQCDPTTKFYQASSSELYGVNDGTALNESSPLKPASPYAAAKLYGYWVAKIYRQAYGMFVSNGILFNHESPLRGLEFVTRRITNYVGMVSAGVTNRKLQLGNLNAARDWGYAPDYVVAMWKTLQQKKPDDFVVSTNEAHTVQEFAAAAFAHAGLDWRKFVVSSKGRLRPLDVEYLRGDYSKARRVLGWSPKVRFKELVEIMAREDMKRWRIGRATKRLAWDAPQYPSRMKPIPKGYMRA